MRQAKRNLSRRKLTAASAQTTARELLDLIKLNAAIKDVAATPAQLKTLHACIKKVTEDLDGMRFNTAISAMMVFINEAMTWETKPVSVLRDFLILLAAVRAAPGGRTCGPNCNSIIRHSSPSLGLRAVAEI